jgi:hypothetical protein
MSPSIAQFLRRFRPFRKRHAPVSSEQTMPPASAPARPVRRGFRLLVTVGALLSLTVVVAGAHVMTGHLDAWLPAPLARSMGLIPPSSQATIAPAATTSAPEKPRQIRFTAFSRLAATPATSREMPWSPAHATWALTRFINTDDLQTFAPGDVATQSPVTGADSGSGSGNHGSALGSIRPASTLAVRAAASAPAVISTHPRLILDSDTLATLRQRAAANTPQWQALKGVCDSYIGGTVNYPSGNAYPDKPNLGSGYQGESYLPALLAEGMCYQVLKSSDPGAAAKYGNKGVDILMKMAAPSSGNGTDPCTDDGYGIRFYGVGYGLGYDWLHGLLSNSQKQQVYTTANAWISAWEKPGGCADFEYEHPQSNYFAGYFHAKAVIALGTYGDNPSAPAEWTDWYTNQYQQRVQPYYAKHLEGGGWPEGYGNYAPLGIFNMVFPAREVKTATGVDIVHASAPFSYPLDSADYAMHFTWPSRSYFDDRDTNHATGRTPPPGTNSVSLFVQLLGTLEYWNSSKASVFREYLNEVRTATSGFNDAAPWLRFLEEDPGGATASINSLPASYFAPGMGMVSARSNWSTSASWMSFRAGPYTNNPGQGEQGFDEGSLALVNGSIPLLVNAYGWMVHDPNGSADEDRLYNDQYGSFNGTQYTGNREMYNVFYVRNMNGSTVKERFGQGAFTSEDDNVRTTVSAYEDGQGYVYTLATHLEDMYRRFSAGPAVSSWSRQIVYLRPNIFVVYDRTTSGSSSYDQYMAWHFPANPASASAGSGENRIDVTYNGTFAGSMMTVLPKDAKLTTVALYPNSNPVKVWQVRERPADDKTSQHWLTVFDTSSQAGNVASTSPVDVTSGDVIGVRVLGYYGAQVMISSAGPAGTPISGSIVYQVPGTGSYHVITDLASDTAYGVSASSSGGGQSIKVSPGGSFKSSPKGVLAFYVTPAGDITDKSPNYVHLPISTMPVDGSPRPYNGR